MNLLLSTPSKELGRNKAWRNEVQTLILLLEVPETCRYINSETHQPASLENILHSRILESCPKQCHTHTHTQTDNWMESNLPEWEQMPSNDMLPSRLLAGLCSKLGWITPWSVVGLNCRGYREGEDKQQTQKQSQKGNSPGVKISANETCLKELASKKPSLQFIPPPN